MLGQNPDAALKVYAISFHMLPSDHLARRLVWPEDLVPDSRVDHFWDEERLVGRFYEEQVTRLGDGSGARVEWDAYFLYGPEAEWGTKPPPHVGWGRPIVGSREALRRELEELLRTASYPPP